MFKTNSINLCIQSDKIAAVTALEYDYKEECMEQKTILYSNLDKFSCVGTHLIIWLSNDDKRHEQDNSTITKPKVYWHNKAGNTKVHQQNKARNKSSSPNQSKKQKFIDKTRPQTQKFFAKTRQETQKFIKKVHC